MESWAEHGARNRIEYRYPLLDRRIVEYALRIPSHLFHRDGWKRHLFREVAQALLPSDICFNKSKEDPAYIQWMLRVAPEADKLLADVLNDRRETIAASGYVHPSMITVWTRELLEADSFTEESFDDTVPPMWLAFLEATSV
jgi:asparagine synthase (glutamine-hydrolysing)